MSAEKDIDEDRVGVEEYDEDADSDFDVDSAEAGSVSAGSDEDGDQNASERSQKRRKKGAEQTFDDTNIELDSGDEATIQEHRKAKRRYKKKNAEAGSENEGEADEWRARTRAMRAHDKEENKRNRLATSKGSTIDVDKIWEEMNKPGPLRPIRIEVSEKSTHNASQQESTEKAEVQNEQGVSGYTGEETVTIKRKFKFAGEVHVEEKKVLKSSAEARLWLAQQENESGHEPEVVSLVQRPTRKISRFDPNHNNLAAFKTSWSKGTAAQEPFKGPKLNVVEKSKMDWAVHVDQEGLKEELDIHAKAKEGYHSRMDFLSQVDQRKEEENRLARMKK